MNIQKQFLATSLVISSILLPFKTSAKGLDFSQIFYFGDSLGDKNNTFAFTLEQIPPAPYFEGRFSNGPTWMEYFAEDLGFDSIPSFADSLFIPGTDISNGINFAFGGALTGTFMTGDDGVTEVENTLPPTFPPLQNAPLLGLQSQVGLFATQFSAIANPDALYIVFAGANDYLPTDADEQLFRPLTETSMSISNISSVVNGLVGLGANNIMLVNLPDLGQVPLTNVLPENERLEFTNLTESHNQGLDIIASSLPDSVNLIQFDLNKLFNQILTNPMDFGLSNVTDACLLDFNCFDPINNMELLSDQYLFWDRQHPTTVVHEIIANTAFDTLKDVPESSFPFGLLVFGAFTTATIINNQRKV